MLVADCGVCVVSKMANDVVKVSCVVPKDLWSVFVRPIPVAMCLFHFKSKFVLLKGRGERKGEGEVGGGGVALSSDRPKKQKRVWCSE